MPGSQLKRLKASLRDQGIIGPQQSKKQKRKHAQDEQARNEKRLHRSAVLESLREQFNPFQFKTSARGPKFEVTSSRSANKSSLGIKGRPGVSKPVGEEKRRETLLVEMQRRNKVGGILDRRFGEHDPSLAHEEMMLERFAHEKQRNYKKASLFDLEEEEELGEELTHLGKSLALLDNRAVVDDFDEADLPSDNESESAQAERKRLKRLRVEEPEENENGVEVKEPERKKTKKEVMEEVIAKSKLYKHERQAAKEEDDDLRAKLDKEVSDVRALLFQRGKPQAGAVDATQETPTTTNLGRERMEKDYDLRLKQMLQDSRAQPTLRTKTEEEMAEEEATKLRELEEERLRRMAGQQDSESDDEAADTEGQERSMASAKSNDVLSDEFGLGSGIKARVTAADLGFDDEDDFIIDDDLVASGSDLEVASSDEEEADEESEADDEFTKGLLTEAESKDSIFKHSNIDKGDDEDGVPYTFPCPQTHSEMLDIFGKIEIKNLPVAVQRIRALYHPKLDGSNREKLGPFSRALVQHIAYLARCPKPLFPTLESLIRHTHSLAKTVPIEVSKEYRRQIEEMSKQRPLALNIGDLIILTAVSTTFPTSDHFHQVVTPAMLCIARYLGQRIPEQLADYATGIYLCTIALEYQKLSKRYVPEVMNFMLNTMCSLAPEKLVKRPGLFPTHEPPPGIRIRDCQKTTLRKLACIDCCAAGSLTTLESKSLKVSLLSTTTAILRAAATLWSQHAAFYETFQPTLPILQHLTSPASSAHLPASLLSSLAQASAALSRTLSLALVSRRPLELHHHRPLAIKTSVPRFEDAFDPGKHYDPDRERAEAAKLRAEHRRERKGALRELRRDAAFVARESLRKKKQTDEAYDRKYKRLVAEIQGEEGRAANEYEREKKARKRAGKRG